MFIDRHVIHTSETSSLDEAERACGSAWFLVSSDRAATQRARRQNLGHTPRHGNDPYVVDRGCEPYSACCSRKVKL